MILQKNNVMVKVYNSYTGDVLGTVPQSTKEDVQEALKKSEKGEQIGRRMPASQRISILKKAVSLMKRDYDLLANLIATEGIKTISQASKEVNRAIHTMQLSAEEASRITGSTIPFDAVEGSEDRVGFEARYPIGLVVAITPFNDPLNLVCHKLGPAIASGNPVILKPSDFTPLVAIKLGEILYESGLPEEMLSIITGSPEVFGDQLINDDRVRLISFTGGVQSAKVIQQKAGIKKITMELGSNSPVIVLSDTDIEDAVEACVSGSFYASGQNCVGVKRVFVHKSIFQEFKSKFIRKTEKLQLGSPLESTTDIGPIVSPEALDEIDKFVHESCENGAKLLIGGKPNGSLYVPTVLEDHCDNEMSNINEVFGPVVTLCEVNDLEQAIACCNKSPFGLHAAIFTNDLNSAYKAIRELDCAGVMINDSTDYRIDSMPFGGVKLSGIGREGVKSAIEAMTEVKVACFKLKK